ncbi:MAG TPA: thioredoxin domain-containing protein, partial [Candidatus Polarisedimenticolia bacterium]|nr:thioredoxin domain-containing protein [Candidatus Polarisedimenticolia bacterium]
LNGVEVPSYDPDTMSRLVAAARSGEDLVAAASREGQRLQSEQAEAMRAQRAKEAARVVEFDLTGAPIKGDPKAPVTIVEFADFQCPYCATSVPLIQQVMQAYPGKVKLAFKHMPLGMHQNAIPAAAASIEAMEHGKFWEMHDLLFQNYTQLTRENIANMGRKLGLDETQLAHALDTSEHSKAIAKDVEDSQKAGVTGTPTFYVNGRKVMQRDFATFKKMIDDALAGRSSTGASPTGV